MTSKWLLGIAALVLLHNSASKAYSATPSLYYSATVGGVKSIYRSTLDGSNATVVLTGATGPFDIDDRTGTIYFEAPSSRTPSTESIWKSNIDGSNRVEFIQNCCLPSRIEIDESNNRLFLAYFRGSEWNLSAPAYIDLGFRTTVEIEFDQIHQTAFLAVGRYAGTGLTDEIYARTDDGVVTPIVTEIRDLNGLGIDPVHQFVYFSARPIDGSDPRAIYRVRMDGGPMERFIDLSDLPGLSIPSDIEVVPEFNAIFWRDDGLGGLWRSDLDGFNIVKLNNSRSSDGQIKVVVPESRSIELAVCFGIATAVRCRRYRIKSTSRKSAY